MFAQNSKVTLYLIPLASYSHRLILNLFNLNFLKLCIQLHIVLLIEIAIENLQRTDPRLLKILFIFYKILIVNLVIFPAIICLVHISKVTWSLDQTFFQKEFEPKTSTDNVTHNSAIELGALLQTLCWRFYRYSSVALKKTAS